MSDQQQDTEITLGTGKLLGLFFGLVAVCGLFFGLGFMLGKSSAPNPNVSLVTESVPTGVATGNTAKPSSARPMEAKAQQGDCPQGQNCTPTPEMSFYKSDQPAPDANSAPATAPAQLPTQTAAVQSDAKPDAKSDAKTAPAPEISKSVPTGTGYIVQIAAVSKQQDAEALVGALRKKSYPVFITNPGDTLFHVQIGPFADVKDAEAMRTKLQGDGYNPILKR
jgi:cell division septation protein DedD